MPDIKTTVNPTLMNSPPGLVPYVPKRSYRSKIDPKQREALLQLVRNKS